MGDAAAIANTGAIKSWHLTRFGVSGAALSVVAVLEGNDTKLFRRMAYRAGSVVPPDLRSQVSVLLMQNWIKASSSVKPVLSTNSDHLAVWLNLVLIALATTQPGRFDGKSLAVDPFAASIPACDAVLSYLSSGMPKAPSFGTRLSERKFQVALSFPGEKREFVAEVATRLRDSGIEVFYDQFYEAELARPDLDVLLQRIYHDNAELIVVFLCEEYERKEWCGLEWRALRDLIKRRRGHSIMPMRFDLTEVPGLFSIDGYVELHQRTPREAAELVRVRLLDLQGGS